MFEADPRDPPPYVTGMGIRSFSLRRLIAALIMLLAIATLTFFSFVMAPGEVAILLI